MLRHAFPATVAALAVAIPGAVMAQTALPQPFQLQPPALTTVISPADLIPENYNYYYAYQTPGALARVTPSAAWSRTSPGTPDLDGHWLETPGT